MKVALHKYDLPDDVFFGDSVAVDTETLGLLIYFHYGNVGKKNQLFFANLL